MVDIESLKAQRADIHEIYDRAFVEIDSHVERLSQSWRVLDSETGEPLTTVYALDIDNVQVGFGACTGLCNQCAMQLVHLRTNRDPTSLIAAAHGREEPTPDHTSNTVFSLREYVVGVNDAIPNDWNGNRVRKQIFIPLIDSIAGGGSYPNVVSDGYNFVVKSFLGTVLEEAGAEAQAADIRALPDITDDESRELARIKVQELHRGASASPDVEHLLLSVGSIFDNRSAYNENGGAILRQAFYKAALLVGWDRVSPLVTKSLVEIAAASNSVPVLGQTNRQVAAKMDEYTERLAA